MRVKVLSLLLAFVVAAEQNDILPIALAHAQSESSRSQQDPPMEREEDRETLALRATAKTPQTPLRSADRHQHLCKTAPPGDRSIAPHSWREQLVLGSHWNGYGGLLRC